MVIVINYGPVNPLLLHLFRYDWQPGVIYKHI